MIPLILCVLFSDAVDEARALLSLAVAVAQQQRQVAERLPVMPVEDEPPQERKIVLVFYRWFPTDNPEWSALYRQDAVTGEQLLWGMWDHGKQEWWQYDQRGKRWAAAPLKVLPKNAPALPARKTSAVPALGQGYMSGSVRLFSRSASC